MSHLICGQLNTGGMLSCQSNPGCVWQGTWCQFRDSSNIYCYSSTSQATCERVGCSWNTSSDSCTPKGAVAGDVGGHESGYAVCGQRSMMSDPDKCSKNPSCVWQDTWCQYRDPNNVFCYSSTNQATCNRVGCEWNLSMNSCYPKAKSDGQSQSSTLVVTATSSKVSEAPKSTPATSSSSRPTSSSNYSDNDTKTTAASSASITKATSTSTSSITTMTRSSTLTAPPSTSATQNYLLTSNARPNARSFGNSLSTLVTCLLLAPGLVLIYF